MRRFSQLELANLAGISSRHLSFLESGRSGPSRDMVQMLGLALDLPLEERNMLHLAAGFVPPHSVLDVAGGGLPHVQQALDFILKQQEPYPAIVIDGNWNITQRNGAAQRLFAEFWRDGAIAPAIGGNAMRTVFHPQGLRPFIVNWAEFAIGMLQILQREVAQGSQASARLFEELRKCEGIEALMRHPTHTTSSSPVMTMQLQRGDYRLDFFSTFTAFAMPADVTLQQLKIECFYPADEATAAIARKLSAG